MGKRIKIKKTKRIQFSREKREKIAKECDYKCQLCPRELKEDVRARRIDHKIPLSQGGTNEDENLWLLCDDCDKYKKNDIVPEASHSAVKKALEKTLTKHPYLKARIRKAD